MLKSQAIVSALKQNIARAVVGKDDAVELLLNVLVIGVHGGKAVECIVP